MLSQLLTDGFITRLSASSIRKRLKLAYTINVLACVSDSHRKDGFYNWAQSSGRGPIGC